MWLLPAVADLVLLAFLRLLLAIPAFDTDIWWHLRTGEWILAHRQVPRVDLFSSTVAGRPWIAHEWLADVVLALGWRAAGTEALVLFQAGMLALAVAVVYRHLHARGSPFLLTVPVATLTLLLVLPAAHPRPYLFTLVFLPLLAYAVTIWGVGQRRTFLLGTVLFVLWANVHGGFVFGLGYLGLVALGEGWRTRRLPARHLALLGLAALAALVNPYGAALLAYPLQYRAGSAHYRLIVEWASPDFHLPFIWLVESVFLATLLAVVVRRADGWRGDLLGVLAFGQLAFLSVRNIPLLGVVAAPILAHHLRTALPPTWRVGAAEPLRSRSVGRGTWSRLRSRFRTVVVLDRRLSGQVWFVLVLVGLALRLAVRPLPPETWQPERAPAIAGIDLPIQAVGVLRQHEYEGRLLNDYGWGGYLIWRLHPRYPVFVDGRADVYGEVILDDYAAMVGLGPGWEELLTHYDVATVLLPPDAPLVELLRRTDGWGVVYEDETAVILRRTTPP